MQNKYDDIVSLRVSDKIYWESIEEYVLFLKQNKAYHFVGDFCRDKHVLDYGCGSGYGTFVLSKYAESIVGVDIDQKVIDYCKWKYKAPNLVFQIIDQKQIFKLGKSSYDVVISFQVIEHVHDVYNYLLELKNLLKQGGLLILSTPNKEHRLLPFQKPWNPEHFREYSLKSLNKELAAVFKKLKILGINGVEDVKSIEYRRVKQDPLKVYIENPIKK
jgi:2-polyprenyl-3-methyl-5-hydroxy-6-metoxy-1,4-benzoquinol methylase